MAASRRTARPLPVVCAAAHVGCTCGGDTVEHNLQAIDRMKARQAAAPRATCPECGGEGNAAVIAGLGRCFDCKRAEDGARYGISAWTH